MTLSGLSSFDSPACVGARIYESGGGPISGSSAVVSAGSDQPVTLLRAPGCDGLVDGSDCDVADVFVLQRHASGESVMVGNVCKPYFGP